MQSPMLGIMLFVFLIFGMAQLTLIASQNIERMKLSVDTNVLKDMEEKSEMRIKHINCSYADLNRTTVLVVNEGKMKLHPEEIDLYFPQRISPENISYSITEETDVLDPGLWNPKEVANFTIYHDLENDTEYTLVMSNEFGIKTSKKCLVEIV